MLLNYLKLALRNLWRGRFYSVITVTGFAVGIAAALLLTLYIRFELSYDRFHANADRIAMVREHVEWSDGRVHEMWWTAMAFGPSILRDFPQVVNQARTMPAGNATLFANNKKLVSWITYADPGFFELFDFPVHGGKPGEVLSEPYSIALSETAAHKFFGNENPVGRTMTYNDEFDVRVAAVYEDFPPNSMFGYDYLLSLETFFAEASSEKAVSMRNDWRSHNNMTFLEFDDPASMKPFETALNKYLLEHAGEEGRQHYEAFVLPMKDTHLNGDYSQLAMFGLIALFILVIASVNYMNLATARSLKRAREIGVRKVLGGTRGHLIRQFLGESVLVTLFSVAVAMLLIELAMPWFSDLVGIRFNEAVNLHTWQVSALLFGFGIMVGILAGSYPALLLSSFRPERVLKSGGSVRGRGTLVRKVLVAVQFAASLALIFCTVVVARQYTHMRGLNSGFDKENIVYVPLESDGVAGQAEQIKQEFLKDPRVLSASVHSRVIGLQTGGVWNISTPAMVDGEYMGIHAVFADADYLETMGLEIIEGRALSEDHPSDKQNGFLLNETAVERLNLDLNKDARVSLAGKEGEVIGVVKDYHFQPMDYKIDPVVIGWLRDTNFDRAYIALRVAPGPFEPLLMHLETVWVKFDPHLAFEYHFLDKWLETQFRSEQRLANLLSLFAGLAIVIASLGLLGLAAYSTETRTKEIGIRKVLGASAGKIVLLLTRDFAMPVLLANLVAWPLAWWLMHDWLEQFPYRAAFPWSWLALGAAAVLLVAWLTMASTTFRAAMRKPARALRYE